MVGELCGSLKNNVGAACQAEVVIAPPRRLLAAGPESAGGLCHHARRTKLFRVRPGRLHRGDLCRDARGDAHSLCYSWPQRTPCAVQGDAARGGNQGGKGPRKQSQGDRVYRRDTSATRKWRNVFHPGAAAGANHSSRWERSVGMVERCGRLRARLVCQTLVVLHLALRYPHSRYAPMRPGPSAPASLPPRSRLKMHTPTSESCSRPRSPR